MYQVPTGKRLLIFAGCVSDDQANWLQKTLILQKIIDTYWVFDGGHFLRTLKFYWPLGYELQAGQWFAASFKNNSTSTANFIWAFTGLLESMK